MPLTKFQTTVLSLLRAHRNPNSYVAGGIAIHRKPSTIRFSNDVDFFHDVDEAVVRSATQDLETLRQEGYRVEIAIDQPSFIRAVISRGNESLKLEWVRDTAFRFFPVISDDLLGFRLHDADLAVNKCLALANRSEIRDVIDLIQLSQSTLSLAGICWAACGKDPGFTPPFLFGQLRRNAIINPVKLEAEKVTQKLNAPALKQQWLALVDEAEKIVQELAAPDLGCLYVEQQGGEEAVIRNPERKTVRNALRHFGTVGGSWPRVVES